MMNYVWVVLIGYLLGSFPSAVVFSKLLKKDDIRKYGSGNPGASNTVRVYGAKMGVLVFICDVSKGLLAALIGNMILGFPGMCIGGSMAVIGHNWPISLNFKGGKGVATSLGMLIAVMPLWAIAAIGVFVLVALIFRYASLSSMAATVFAWIITVVNYSWNTALLVSITVLTVMIIWRHRSNIDRLVKGTESKIDL